MLDRPARRVLRPVLAAVAAPLHRVGVTPNQLTAAALLVALVAAGLAATGETWAAAGAWLASRVLDGLDGALAREAVAGGGADGPGHDPDLGGYLDVLGDFTAYAAVPLGVAYAVPEARLAIAVLLGTYYLNGSAFLAFSSIAERRGIQTDDRSFQFLGGLAEGFETIAVHTALLLFPGAAATIAWTFAAVVAVTVVERVVLTARRIRTAPGRPSGPRRGPGAGGDGSGA